MRRLFSSATLVLSLLLLGFSVACQQAAPPAPPDTRAADAQAVRAADEAWSKAAAAKDLEGCLSFLADDITTLAPNSPVKTGKDAARKSWTESFTRPGFSISWKIDKVEASGGDLAYSMGSYEESMDDAKGKPVTDRGKYVTIWKKQADGKWKAVVDAFNSDLLKPEAGKK